MTMRNFKGQYSCWKPSEGQNNDINTKSKVTQSHR